MLNQHQLLPQKLTKIGNTIMTKPQGLMPNVKAEMPTPRLDKLRAEFSPKKPLSLESQLASMSNVQLQSLTTTVQMLAMVYDQTDERNFFNHVEQIYPKAPLAKKHLYVDLLKELIPTEEYKGPQKPVRNYTKDFYDRADMKLLEDNQTK